MESSCTSMAHLGCRCLWVLLYMLVCVIVPHEAPQRLLDVE